MKKILPEKLKNFACALPFPLYVVGGSVRDFLSGLDVQKSPDWDICAPVQIDEFLSYAKEFHLTAVSVFKHTGTVKLVSEDGVGYEFSCFRSDEYVRGEHTPAQVYFTDDIKKDALRRDFTCNAVYYDIKAEKFVDPLCGMEDIKKKSLRTVREASRVFSEDGLRLLRLARLSAQTGFIPTKDTISGARENAALLKDVVPERIFTELKLLLTAKKAFQDGHGAYLGLKILDKTRVLDVLLPELAMGRGMAQRSDFHRYDVLQHSLKCVLYATEEVRLAALLHDVGKPFCKLRDGNVYAHPEEGERIANEILQRLKAPKEVTKCTCELIKYHMYDMDCKTKEAKIRRFLVLHQEILPQLFALKQADFSACKDDLSVAPTVAKWKGILQKMQEEGAPMSEKELDLTGKELLDIGMQPCLVGKALKELLLLCAVEPKKNKKEILIREAFLLKF